MQFRQRAVVLTYLDPVTFGTISAGPIGWLIAGTLQAFVEEFHKPLPDTTRGLLPFSFGRVG
jgi:hypothetical protein